MKHIPLDRQFAEWRDGDSTDPNILAMLGHSRRLLSWAQVLERRRVVVLAEAGSGKTDELKEQARLLREQGKPAFHTTVEELARSGLPQALRPAERAGFGTWLASQDDGWLFLDSIDEAKLDGVRLELALLNAADALHTALKRIRVVLSGRYSDWEFEADFKRLSECLPAPEEPSGLAALPPDQAIIALIERKSLPEPKSADEPPLVVVMVGLDADRVRTFARAKQIEDVDAFVDGLEKSSLWPFARRPRDLDWLAQYYRDRQSFGTLAQVLDECIEARLREDEPRRARGTSLTAEKARAGVRRVAAALVFGGANALAIPDGEVTRPKERTTLDINQVLPDWTPGERQQLLRLPVFDPATFGKARLHNDNDGTIRAFLTAEWCHSLRENNCPTRIIRDLLFADIYGLKLVKPSMAETSAWYSLLDREIAEDVVRREPRILLNYGDPGSLAAETKRLALAGLVEEIRSSDRRHVSFENDALRRFSSPEIAADIRRMWTEIDGHEEIEGFLLRLVWLGNLRDCVDLAEGVAFGEGTGRRHELSKIVAGRALLAMASEKVQCRYAKHVMEHFRSSHELIVWDAVEALFPRHIGIDDLLEVVRALAAADPDKITQIEIAGKQLAARLSSTSELERLLRGLLSMSRHAIGNFDGPEDDVDRRLAPLVSQAASNLLALLPSTEASDPSVDAAIWIASLVRASSYVSEGDVVDLVKPLHATPERRRAAYWRASRTMNRMKYLEGGPVRDAWQMRHFGWEHGLTIDDLDWLLSDFQRESDERLRTLALDGAMTVWSEDGRKDSVLDRIQAAIPSGERPHELVRRWTTPRPQSPELLAMEKKHETMRAQRQRRQDEINKSWVEFGERLRSNPDQLRHLNPTTATTVDSRLHSLWQLLSNADRGATRYAIDSCSALLPVLGREVVEAAEDAFIQFWKDWTPKVVSSREPDERASSFSFDSMGIAGISMQVKRDDRWAQTLTPELAERAAQYATLELSGFPFWVDELARQHPSICKEAFLKEAIFEVEELRDHGRGILEDLASGPTSVLSLVASPLSAELARRGQLTARCRRSLIEIAERGLRLDQASDFVDLTLQRFRSAPDADEGWDYFGAAFRVNPVQATASLLSQARMLVGQEQSDFLADGLVSLFGGWSARRRELPKLPFEILETLLLAAFGAVRMEDDRIHRGAFTPDRRDDAEHARSHLLKILATQSGRATFETLLRLSEAPLFKPISWHLIDLSVERAKKDGEHESWDGADAIEFEKTFDDVPRTPIDLVRLLQRRLEQAEHDLNHGEFQQAETLHSLPNETAVQKWVGSMLQDRQRRAYTIMREPNVAEEKVPDVRARANASSATAPIEVKLAEDWTRTELEHALNHQLCQQYLRHRDERHGILLLVHRRPRRRGWEAPDGGGFWSFNELVAHLERLAATISATGPDAPQPAISTLDVIRAVPKKRTTSRKRNSKKSAGRASSAAGSTKKRATN